MSLDLIPWLGSPVSHSCLTGVRVESTRLMRDGNVEVKRKRACAVCSNRAYEIEVTIKSVTLGSMGHGMRHDARLDLGHTLPPCLSPYQASSASSLLLLVMCIYASMHRSCLDGEPRLGVALAFTGARTCPHARSNARPVSACRGLATVAVVQKPRKARDVGLPWYIPGFASRV